MVQIRYSSPGLSHGKMLQNDVVSALALLIELLKRLLAGLGAASKPTGLHPKAIIIT